MLKALLILIRPSHWVKNSILLAPLVFAGEAGNVEKVKLAFLAAVAFSLLSSAVYIFNDLIDRKGDRAHPQKKYRPLASGQVSPSVAILLGLTLSIAGLLISFSMNQLFLNTALAYFFLSLAYSIYLKNLVIVDVMTIAIGFVIRALAGAYAVDVPASSWLLITTLLLALFLGFGKRRHELVLLEENATDHRKILSHYSPYMLDQCILISTASVLVMYMLYTISSDVINKVGTDKLFLTIPFVIYGIFRYLYLIHKEEKGGSPTSILLNDRPILLTVALWALTAIIILYIYH